MKNSGYWVATGLLTLGLAMAGLSNVSLAESIKASLGGLGYPLYFSRIIGVWMLLAVPALLAPNFKLLKEWTYAGLVFLFTGAMFSHVAAGGPVSTVIPGTAFLLLAMTSWSLGPSYQIA